MVIASSTVVRGAAPPEQGPEFGGYGEHHPTWMTNLGLAVLILVCNGRPSMNESCS